MNKPEFQREPDDSTRPVNSDPRLLGGRYHLLQKIGEGGAAEVFRARDELLGRIVAIKLLRPQFTADQASRTRFANEAKTAANLSHPNIIDVYDFGEAPDGSMYIVMQYLEGEDLKAILQTRGRLHPSEAISIAIQVCGALSAAHSQGLIHRDVKPQNILIDRSGNVHLTDFGIVKALSGPSLTQSGMTFGTAAYLSPEQATGAPIGPASDIYALGCVMYELLSGSPPFTGDNPAVVAYKQVWEQPRPLHDLVPEVLPSLEAAVMRCLNKDPNRRYPTAAALAAELESLSAGSNQPTQAVSLGPIAAAGAAAAAAGGWAAAGMHPPAEQALPIPVPVQSAGVPPVRAATTAPAYAPTQRVAPYTPPPPIPPRGAVTTRGGGGSRDVSLAWLPVALVLLILGLGIIALAAAQGRDLLGFLGGHSGIPAPPSTQTPLPTATVPLGGVIIATPGTPSPLPTDTPAPPRPTSTPPPPTGTPAPTDTPGPPPPPTDTPQPGQRTSPPTVTLQPSDFSGGYTRSDGLYHGVPATWVYGQGTPYHTMSAGFNLDTAPDAQATLSIVGVDSEDPPKTPMLVQINGTQIYSGPDPLPNDFTTGVDGPGNWGTVNFTAIPPEVFKQGANTITITNLDPSDKVNYPIFIMVRSATLTWQQP